MARKLFRLYSGKKNCILCNIKIVVIVFHSVHGIRFKLVSNWDQSILYTKSLQVLNRKEISMLTGLKVPSLTCKYLFYRPELNAKARAHGIEFCKPWNIPMDRV